MWSKPMDYPTDFALALLDIEKMEISILHTGNEENQFLVATEWANDGLIYLTDRKTSDLWQINPITKELQKRK